MSTTSPAGRGPLRVTVGDRFALGGFSVRVCLGRAGSERAGVNVTDATAGRLGRADGSSPASAKGQCQDVVLAPGQQTARVTFRRLVPGRSQLTVTAPFGHAVHRVLAVRRAGRHFTLLATGDSMIQIVDGFLKQRLASRGGHVVSDAHISTGISKPSLLNWPKHAAGSAASVHPDVTVMIVGANDGFAFGGVACCGDAWTRAYADRAAGMMRSYLRGGRGRVIWMLLPAPRRGNFVPVMRAVNDALHRAAVRFRTDQVTLLDLPATFTPGGVFRDAITWHGALRHVRQPDGVHLNTAGASIAAELVIRQLRADGFLR